MSNLVGKIKFSMIKDADSHSMLKIENVETGKDRYFHHNKIEDAGFSPETVIKEIEKMSQNNDECEEAPTQYPDEKDKVIEEPTFTQQKATAYVKAVRKIEDKMRVLTQAEDLLTDFTGKIHHADVVANMKALQYAQDILKEAYEESVEDE